MNIFEICPCCAAELVFCACSSSEQAEAQAKAEAEAQARAASPEAQARASARAEAEAQDRAEVERARAAREAGPRAFAKAQGFEVERLLGFGCQGSVWVARRLSDGALGAFKITSVEEAAVEAQCLRRLGGYHAPVLLGEGPGWVFSEIILGTVGGDIDKAAKLAASIEAKYGLRHGDVANRNFITNRGGEIVLLDWGMATILS